MTFFEASSRFSLYLEHDPFPKTGIHFFGIMLREGAMREEFKKFALKGSVVDLAVGVIIGAAFGAIVTSLVGDIIMPVIGSIGSVDFSNYFLPLNSTVTATVLAEA